MFKSVCQTKFWWCETPRIGRNIWVCCVIGDNFSIVRWAACRWRRESMCSIKAMSPNAILSSYGVRWLSYVTFNCVLVRQIQESRFIAGRLYLRVCHLIDADLQSWQGGGSGLLSCKAKHLYYARTMGIALLWFSLHWQDVELDRKVSRRPWGALVRSWRHIFPVRISKCYRVACGCFLRHWEVLCHWSYGYLTVINQSKV